MKAYVIDTGVLLDDPDMINKLGIDQTVIIPTAVIKELDMNKTSQDEHMAKAARQMARTLDHLGSYKDLVAGGQLNTGTILRTCTGYERIGDFGDDIDNRIVGTALKLKSEFRYVAVVSKDRAMRDVARSYGLRAKNYPFYLTSLDKMAPAAAPAPLKTTAPARESFLRRLLRHLKAALKISGPVTHQRGKRPWPKM